MATDGTKIARSEGVSTLKPGGAPATEQSAPANTREPLLSRTTRQERAELRLAASGADRGRELERAAADAEETAGQEQEQLEARETKLEGKIEDAKLKGDAKAVRTLQSDLDTTRGQLRQVETERDAWPAWIVQMAQAGKTPAQMVEAVRAAQTANAAKRAITQRSEPDEIIAGLIDSGDDEDLGFARFLRKRQKAEFPITQKNLATHREEYEQMNARTSPSANTTEKKVITPPGGARKTPPKVAGHGGGDLGGEQTGWKPNVSTTELLTRGFAEQDRARRQH